MLPLIDSPSSPVLRGTLNSIVFLLSLVLLEQSADIFVESTERLAKRLGVPTILVGLLTAGAEWEELAVVVSSLIQHNPALALSNIYGSSIANILGSFSIGLLFSPRPLHGEEKRSARIYTTLLLFLSVFITFLGSGVGPDWNIIKPGGLDQDGASRWVIGGTLVGIFMAYIMGIAYGIYKGVVTAPEGSDSESDGETESSDEVTSLGTSVMAEEEEEGDWRRVRGEEEEGGGGGGRSRRSYLSWLSRKRRDSYAPSERTPLFSRLFRSKSHPDNNLPIVTAEQAIRRRQRSRLLKDIFLVTLSTAMLSFAGFLLSSTTASLASVLNLTQSSLGLTLLSFSTTLPEKLVAFKSGRKSQTGVLVANTVGSNVFLGSLVLGITWLAHGRIDLDPSGPRIPGDGRGRGIGLAKAGRMDALVVLGSSMMLTIVVWAGAFRRWIGVCMLIAYVVYILSVFLREETRE